MNPQSSRRTQADRSATTRAALVDAARPLFAEHGFAGVGTEAVVRAAGVTRGALYHQFRDKTDLFAAVFETVEAEVLARIAQRVARSDETDPVEIARRSAHAWLDACAEPEVQQIVLLDAPGVLGWERWREIGLRHGLGVVQALLEQVIAAGAMPAQPVEPLAHVLVGALDEAALYVARSPHPRRARREVGVVLDALVDGMTRGAYGRSSR